MDASFKKIDSLVSKERNKEKQPWSNMTMIIGKDGDIAGDNYGNIDYLSESDWMPKDLIHK